MTDPIRGEVWFVDLDPVRGHEQAGLRPALIISADLYNEGPSELIVVAPITSRRKTSRWLVEIEPPEGGLTVTSFIKCDDIRSISKHRLVRWVGLAKQETIDAVADRIRILLDL